MFIFYCCVKNNKKTLTCVNVLIFWEKNVGHEQAISTTVAMIIWISFLLKISLIYIINKLNNVNERKENKYRVKIRRMREIKK